MPRHLEALPSDLHWFCPRTSPDDVSLYFDEDVLSTLPNESLEEREARHTKIEETQQLKKRVLLACQILAYDGDRAVQLTAILKDMLKVQLKRCTVCVREYHR